jgi:sterol desaturase/sphingolipid hydroxylase (fatty acid hydroxylase superfamily)
MQQAVASHPEPASEKASLLSYLVFPVTLGLGLLSTAFFSQQTDSPITVAIVVSMSAMVVVGVLERIVPYRRDWNVSRGDIGTDFWHTLINQILLSRALNILWIALLAGATARLAESYGTTLWPHHWPLIVQLMLMLLIAEFGRYWVHRLAHRNPWLWRLHAVHHSPARLYFFNAGRVHPLEKVLYLVPEVVPFIILGTNIECLAMYATFNSIHGFFQHGNVNVRLGPLNYFFSMAELHRWHHSRLIEESDRNFGNNLSVWDVAFGTWFLPRDRQVGTLGLQADDYPEGYLTQVKAPFQARDISKPIVSQPLDAAS